MILRKINMYFFGEDFMESLEHLTSSKIRDLFGIEIVEGAGSISQFGGVAPFIQFLEKSRLRERLEGIFGHFKARTMCQMVVSLVLGCEDFEEAERLGKDPIVKKYLRNPVTATQLARDFKKFTPSEIQELHEFVMSLCVCELVDFIGENEIIELEVDQTAVEKFGKLQEGVAKGYVDKDKIEYCYQYLFFRLANLNTFLYGTVRDGSCHSQHDFCGYLRQFLPVFKSQARRVNLKADSGYFSEEAFDVCQENGIFFYVKAPMSWSRRQQALSNNLQWQEDPVKPGIEHAVYETVTKNDSIWYEVFKRTPKKDGAATLFGDHVEYDYQCIATNDKASTQRPWTLWPYYNQRANIENNIRELKRDYNLGSIVTGCFSANDAITQTTLMTYILVQHFKRMFLDENQQKIQLSTLRWRAFNMIGCKRRGGRSEWVKVFSVFLTSKQLLRILFRIKEKTSILIHPPPLYA